MSEPDVIDGIILILEGLILLINLCERGYKTYKAYKARKEESKRMKARMARNGDNLEDSDPRIGGGANSCWMSPLHHQHGQGDYTRETSLTEEVEEAPLWKRLELFTDDQLDSIENELLRELELAKMERPRRD